MWPRLTVPNPTYQWKIHKSNMCLYSGQIYTFVFPPPFCASGSGTEMGKSLTQEHPRAQSKKIPLTSQPALTATHGGITPSVISPDTWPSAPHGVGGRGCTGGHSTAADSRQTFQIFKRNHLCLPYLLISPPFKCLVSVWPCLYSLWGVRLPNIPSAWGIGRQINTSCSLTFKFLVSASIWLANHNLASHFFFCFLPNHGYPHTLFFSWRCRRKEGDRPSLYCELINQCFRMTVAEQEQAETEKEQ